MKRLFSGILALSLAFLLWGCSAAPEQTVVCGELTISLPASFMDFSDQHYDKDLTMVFGYQDVIVSASRESAPELKAQIPGLDAYEYARLVIQTNGVDAQVQEKDGIPTFSYTMGSGDEAFTYLAAVCVSEKYFWLVQCFCPADTFSQHHQSMWKYLSTVKIH